MAEQGGTADGARSDADRVWAGIQQALRSASAPAHAPAAAPGTRPPGGPSRSRTPPRARRDAGEGRPVAGLLLLLLVVLAGAFQAASSYLERQSED
ncbi:MAG TPA: hypothetical protein VLU41_10720, partial [Ideonella sp.]|nr:hypothetical protein [Ideonella sp.]